MAPFLPFPGRTIKKRGAGQLDGKLMAFITTKLFSSIVCRDKRNFEYINIGKEILGIRKS
jgi:hypothetical protein